MKNIGPEADIDWMYFINIENFTGYNVAVDPTLRQDIIEDWFEKDYPHTIDGDAEEFNRLFRDGIRHLFKTYYTKPEKVPTVGEYITCKDWAKGRGTEAKSVKIKNLYNGNIKNSRHSKINSSLVLEDDIILDALFNIHPQRLRCFQKPEGGKIRDVVSGDFENYIKMDFLSTRIEDGFLNTDFCPIYASRQQVKNMWSTIIDEAKCDSILKVPIDQGSFDHQPNRTMLIIVFEELTSVLDDPTDIKIAISLMNSIFSPLSTYKNGDHIGPYIKGVASGWRWTAFIDTIINYAEFFVVKEVFLRRNNRQLAVTNVYYQGDDIRLGLIGDKDDGKQVLEIYADMEFDINYKKNFLAYDRDEFLRFVAHDNVLHGYPARIIPALTQLKPASLDDPSVLDRLVSLVSCYQVTISRGCDPKKVVRAMINNLTNLFTDGEDLSPCPKKIVQWICTPSSYGGYGLPIQDLLYTHLMLQYQSYFINQIYYSIEPSKIKVNISIVDDLWTREFVAISKALDYPVSIETAREKLLCCIPNISKKIKVIQRAKFVPVVVHGQHFIINGPLLISSISPTWKFLYISKFYHNIFKEQAISDMDVNKLLLLLTEESGVDLLTMLNRHVSRGVVKLWLKSSLAPTSRPWTAMRIVQPCGPCLEYNPAVRRILSTRDMTVPRLQRSLCAVVEQLTQFESDSFKLSPILVGF